VWQSVSRALVIPVGLAQIAQGLAGPLLARVLDLDTEVQVLAGLAAIVANNWNPLLGFTGGRGIGQSIGFLLALAPAALAVFIFIALVGVAMRAIPQFVALAIVVAPLGAVVAGGETPVVLGCVLVAAIAMLKRVTGNGVPSAGHPRPRVYLYRLIYDRDVREREAWIRRGIEAPPGQ
jgi:glycerol-3-phosphate acyltransferase PlsY